MVKLSRHRAEALLTELLRGYSAPSFQSALAELLTKQGHELQKTTAEAQVEFLYGRSELVRQVQRQVLGRYGFNAGQDGILEMKAAIREHLKAGDKEVKRLSKEIRSKLRLPELPSEFESTEDEAFAEDEFADFATPSGAGFFSGRSLEIVKGSRMRGLAEELCSVSPLGCPTALLSSENSCNLKLDLCRNISVADAKKFVGWWNSVAPAPWMTCDPTNPLCDQHLAARFGWELSTGPGKATWI